MSADVARAIEAALSSEETPAWAVATLEGVRDNYLERAQVTMNLRRGSNRATLATHEGTVEVTYVEENHKIRISVPKSVGVKVGKVPIVNTESAP